MKDKDFMLDEEDEVAVKQLIDGLEKIDQWNPVSTPNIQWFQEKVELEKKRLRKKQWRDLITFISIALFVLVVVFTVVYRQPIVFLYFQLVGILLLPLAFNKTRKKVRNE